MRANKISVEYLGELLQNVKLKTECSVCRSTITELQTWVKKEMIREGWD